MGQGFVYFIGCPETLRLKIGHAINPYARLSALQTGSPTKLVMTAMHPGSHEDERKLHEKFAAHRLHGEWFELHEDIFEYICMAVWLAAADARARGVKPARWIKVGLQSMHEASPLPDEIAALL